MAGEEIRLEFSEIERLGALVLRFASDLQPLAEAHAPTSSSAIVDEGVGIFMGRYGAAVAAIARSMHSHGASIGTSASNYSNAESSITSLEL